MTRSLGVYGIGSSGEALADRPNGRATAPILDGERPSAIEADRSRRGTEPISARNRTDLGDGENEALSGRSGVR
jgi:hypothetical protein